MLLIKPLETQVNSEIEALSDDMKSLKYQNEELRKIVQQLQEKHFKELDDRLSKWREEQKKKKINHS